MSFGGTRTKKMTTYGRKKTQIINVHSDFSPVPVPTTRQTPPLDPASPLQARTTRPPLSSILSNNLIPVLSVDESTKNTKPKARPNGKGKQPVKNQKLRAPIIVISDTSDSEIDNIAPETNNSATRNGNNAYDTDDERIIQRPRRRNIIPSSPSTSLATSTARPARRNQRISRAKFDGVEILARRSTRGITEGLTDRIAELHIRSSVTPAPTSTTDDQDHSQNQGIAQLTATCSSPFILPFRSFQTSPTFIDTIWPEACAKTTSTVIRKIGEASYSEVFGLTVGNEEVVVKVIPLVSEGEESEERGDKGVDRPDCSGCGDVKREIAVTKHMASLEGGGFVKLLGAFIVQGQYSDDLLREWDIYRNTLGTESIRPDCFTDEQQYALIVLTHGGPDLESFRFDASNGWIQAAGIFWQVATSLAKAEERTQFEHRDLHEGQILLQTTPIELSSNDYAQSSTCGVRATIIDFGLSRLDMPGDETAWTSLPEDVYDGVGEQWDVYRQMRDTVKGDWEGVHPITNVMWLSYLCRYLIHSKGLRKPRPTTKTRAPTTSLRPTRRVVTTPLQRRPVTNEIKGDLRSENAWSMLHAVEEVLRACFQDSSKVKRGKKVTPREELGSAVDVVAWGKRMGWIAT